MLSQRGVILIGHSQGSFILRDLIKNEIDGKETQKNLVSAHLGGVVIATSKTDAAKNEFKTIPACTDGSQTGCFISFSSFEQDAPPPSWSKAFGMSIETGTTNNCSNPAELSGDNGRLIPYIDASRPTEDGKSRIEWTDQASAPGTPLITLPDFLEAKCVTREPRSGERPSQAIYSWPCHRWPGSTFKLGRTRRGYGIDDGQSGQDCRASGGELAKARLSLRSERSTAGDMETFRRGCGRGKLCRSDSAARILSFSEMKARPS
jgi:hypothetical protein